MRQKHPKSSQNAKTPLINSRINKIRNEVLKTLTYSDLFDYPLTADQIFQYLGVKVKGKDLLTALKTVPYTIVGRKIWYFLPKHHNLIEKRLQREKWSNKKIEKAKRVSHFLGLIPTIRFIGISGSLSLKNADQKSDIDLFFICAPYTVWLTRFFVYTLLFVLGMKRKRNKKSSQAVCANMFMDEKNLTFPKIKRNLYIAHEIVQLFPLVDKNNAYQQLLTSNSWIKDFFPNIAFPKRKRKKEESLVWKLFLPIEYVFYKAQLWYMRDRKTRETVTNAFIAFHPIDYEKMTLSMYNKKSAQYGI